MLRIGFLSIHNPYDRNSFSGTTYYMYQALCRAEGALVSVVAEREHKRRFFLERLLDKLNSTKMGDLKVVGSLSHSMSKRKIKKIKKSLENRRAEYDVIVAPVASDLIGTIADIDAIPPIIFLTDATHEFIAEEYKWRLDDTHKINESKTIERARSIIYSSQFMADRALTEFHVDTAEGIKKISFVPFGLNMDRVDLVPPKDVTDECLRLLFVGRDWQRKGGSLALNTARRLREIGIDVELTIVGADPEEVKELSWVTTYRFLDKNDREQQDLYLRLLQRSHFLLLPTRADCTPMVIAEANAFSTPVIATSVGGIPSLISNDKNGFLLDLNSVEDDYAKIIIDCWRDPKSYRRLSVGARRMYEKRLNWDSWAREIVDRARNLCK